MPITVTIARQLGCGGAYLGHRIADVLGIRCLDREIVSQAAQNLTCDETELLEREERGLTFWERMLAGIVVGAPEALYHAPSSPTLTVREVFEAETEVLKQIAGREDCVIVGRAASHVLPTHASMVNLFLHAPMRFRIQRVMEFYDANDESQARAKILRSDESRARFITQMIGRGWDDAKNYHLCLETSSLPLEEIADILTDFVRRKTRSLGVGA
jgi:cytidylate kinase